MDFVCVHPDSRTCRQRIAGEAESLMLVVPVTQYLAQKLLPSCAMVSYLNIFIGLGPRHLAIEQNAIDT